LSGDAVPGWPPGVKQIGVGDLRRLGLDAENQLYWGGKRVEVRRTLVLTLPQKLFAALAVLASLATIATGVNNFSVFLCARDVHWLGCPAPQSRTP
jgi:hypothetical protein